MTVLKKSEAFSANFGSFGGIFIALAVTLFAFSTCLGWSFYGKKAWEYLFGTKSTIIYKVVFLAATRYRLPRGEFLLS